MRIFVRCFLGSNSKESSLNWVTAFAMARLASHQLPCLLYLKSTPRSLSVSRPPACLLPPGRGRSSTGRPEMIFCWLLREFLPSNLWIEAPQTFPYAPCSLELARLSCGPISKHASRSPIPKSNQIDSFKSSGFSTYNGSPLTPLAIDNYYNTGLII